MATPGSAGVLPARVRMMESLKCDQLRAVLGALRVSKQGNKGALQERVLSQLSQPSPRERAAAEKAVADVYAAAHAVSLGPPPTLASAPSPPAAAQYAGVAAAPLQPWEAKALDTARESDPFWQPARGSASLCLLPTRLQIVPGHRASGWAGPPPTLTQAERSFTLAPDDVALLRRGGATAVLQFFCVRLDDPVRGRLHWPCHASLSVSGVSLSVPCRTSSHDLGPGGRDPPATAPPALLSAALAGVPLRVTLAGYDSRPFAVLAYVARPRAMAEVTADVPPAAPFEAGLRAACAAVRGDDADTDVLAGSDSDDVAGVTVDALPLSLRDPISGARVQHPVRFAGCTGLAVFDLPTFLAVTQRSRRWQCPRCTACGGPSALRRDAYVAAVLAASAALDDVDDVEVNREGHWRPRLPGGGFGRWVSPAETEAAARPGAPRLQMGPPAGGPAPPPVKRERDGNDEDDDAVPAAAAAPASTQPAHDVIDLCDSDGDDVPAAKRAAFAPSQPPPPATQPQGAAPAPGLLRVRLGVPAEARLMPRMQPTPAPPPGMPSLFPMGAPRPSLSELAAAAASRGGAASIAAFGHIAPIPLRTGPGTFHSMGTPRGAGGAAPLDDPALRSFMADAFLDGGGWRSRNKPPATQGNGGAPPPPETIEIDDD